MLCGQIVRSTAALFLPRPSSGIDSAAVARARPDSGTTPIIMMDQCAPVWLWAVRYHEGRGCQEVPRGQVLRPRAAHSLSALPLDIDSAAYDSSTHDDKAQSGRACGNKFGRAKCCHAAWILPVGVSEEVVECGGRGTAAADVLTGPTSCCQACGVGSSRRQQDNVQRSRTR